VEPEIDYVENGLRHRLWVIPAEGANSEMKYYCVGDDPYAVSFIVHTGKHHTPERQSLPRGSSMDWHRRAEKSEFMSSCACLSGAPCTSDGTSLGADEWYANALKEGPVSGQKIFEFLHKLYEEWK
jgi:hypothetical protein